MRANTIDGALRWWAARHPDRAAIVFEKQAISYAELDAWVGRVAAALCDDGLRPGDRVVICADNSPELVALMFAAMRAGAISAGIGSSLVLDEIEYLVSLYEPRFTYLDAAARGRVEALDLPVVPLEGVGALRHGPARDCDVELSPDAAAMIVSTSGSTSRPKGAVFTNQAMIDSAIWKMIANPFRVDVRKQLVASPMSASGGAFPCVHTLILGGTAYLERKFDAARALDLIVNDKLNVITAVPLYYDRIAKEPGFAAADVSSLKYTITGGAPVPVSLLKTWADKGVLLRQMYGQTEAGGLISENAERDALAHPDRCGSSSPFVDIAIVGEDGRPVKSGEPGQIVARTRNMMMGYWRDPEATGKAIVDGWLQTGDVGLIDENGLLKMVDRLKDIIISGGLNVAATEVEEAILGLDGVLEVAVIPVASEAFGESPFAVVHAAGDLDEEGLIAHCKARLAKYKVPKAAVIWREPLPRLAAGKIDKKTLRAKYAHVKL